MADDAAGGQLDDQAGEHGGVVQVVVLDPDRVASRNLRPFVKGDARAAEMGKRGADARRAKRDAGRADVEAVALNLSRVRASFDRGDLGPTAAAVAAELLGRIASGEVPVRNGGEAAELLRVLVDVARIEAGEATSTSVVAHLGAAAVDRVRAMRAEAAAALGPSSSVQAADDPPVPSVDG